jgi:choline dehydrogenase
MPDFDYVIVGAGSAGCVLANRLTADGASRVALVEAGGSDSKTEIHVPAAFSKLFKTPCDWDYATTPQKNLADRSLYWPRGKVLGGSSSINAQMWVRGTRADYDGWDLPGWSYDEVKPYFRKIERRVGSNHGDVYGIDGPVYIEEVRTPNPLTTAFLDACHEIGLERLPELNGDDNTGYSPTPVTQHNGRRWSCVDAYLKPVRKRPNLTVITGGLVEKVFVEDGRATGISYRPGDGAPRTLAANREVVLCAGAIGSPQILMRSGVGDPDELDAAGVAVTAARTQVGKNLQDHLVTGWIMHATTPVSMTAAEKPGQLVRYLLTRKGMLASNVAEAIAMIRTQADLAGPDVEIIFAPVPFIDHGLTAPPGHGLTVGAILLQPHSRGTVTLTSTDAALPPAIDAGYFTDERDVRVMYDGMQFARRLIETAALGAHVAGPMRPERYPADELEAESMMRQYAETLYHPVGTCRMGADPESVVDPELRVRGVDALRVVDASVMPRLIRGHTHAPTVMIAEKAADLMRRRTRQAQGL